MSEKTIERLKQVLKNAQDNYAEAARFYASMERKHAQGVADYDKALLALRTRYSVDLEAMVTATQTLDNARVHLANAALALAASGQVGKDTVDGLDGVRLHPLTVWHVDNPQAIGYLAQHHPDLVRVVANATLDKALAKADADELAQAGITSAKSFTPVIDRANALKAAREALQAGDEDTP